MGEMGSTGPKGFPAPKSMDPLSGGTPHPPAIVGLTMGTVPRGGADVAGCWRWVYDGGWINGGEWA